MQAMLSDICRSNFHLALHLHLFCICAISIFAPTVGYDESMQEAYHSVFVTEDGVRMSLSDTGMRWIQLLMERQDLHHPLSYYCSHADNSTSRSVFIASQIHAAMNGICAWRREKNSNKIIVKRTTGIPLFMHELHEIERGVYISLIFILISVLVLRDFSLRVGVPTNAISHPH